MSEDTEHDSVIREDNMGKEIELSVDKIAIDIPAATIELEIIATVYLDGEMKKVSNKMGLAEVRNAIRDADANYIDPDAKYSITGKGLAYLTEQEQVKRDA